MAFLLSVVGVIVLSEFWTLTSVNGLTVFRLGPRLTRFKCLGFLHTDAAVAYLRGISKYVPHRVRVE